MAFVLTEEQTLLRDSARAFMAENAPVAQLRKLRDAQEPTGFSRPLWQRFVEMGFTGMLVPEAFEGLGLGHTEVALVMQEIGRNLTASPLLASSVVAVTALLRGAHTAQKQMLLPALARGERIATLAIDEASKHQPPEQLGLQAIRSGAGWQLSGQKTFVLDGHVADWLLVAARTSGTPGDASGLALFLVARETAGLAVEHVAMADSHNAARVRFNRTSLRAEALLGEIDDASVAIDAALDAGRVAAAAEMLGLADEVFARTLTQLKERKQFDRHIGEFQALQHRAAMLYCDIELARAAVSNAASKLDSGAPETPTAVAIAKARAGTSATRAVQEAVQMHGGMGMTDALDLGLFMKRARVLQEYFGDAAFHANRLAIGRDY